MAVSSILWERPLFHEKRDVLEKHVLKKALLCLLIFPIAFFFFRSGCPFYRLTGIPCPVCGMTRAYLAALRLNFSAAFRLHPLWPSAVPLIILILWKEGKIFRDKKKNICFYAGWIVLFLAVYFYRMLTLFPNTEPMVLNPNAPLFQLIRLFISRFY